MNKALLVSALASHAAHAIKNCISPKEDVVRMARSGKIYEWFWLQEHREDFASELAALSEFATAARADLVAENERLLSALTTQRSYSIRNSQDEQKNHRELTAARSALAAVEARETKLLRLIEKLPCESESLLWEVINEKRDALVQPRDDSALREMIAGVYEECAKVVGRQADVASAVVEIRALAEKARHGS